MGKPDARTKALPKREAARWVRQALERLKERGIVAREVGDRLGVSERSVRAYASGQFPLPYTVQYALEAMLA